ncbi:MAG TPA: TetR/AcrR family transcriptional regulator, partial [Pseudoalteromonas prydzensis]
MKPKAKRQTDPAIAQARREQILTAAAECFRRKGYHGAGMAEISKTAGMSAGHIYNYFESKEAIIESIIEKDMEEMFSIFQQFEDHPGDVLAALLDGLN